MGIRLAQALRSGAIAVIFLSPAVAAQRVSAAEVDVVAPAVASLRAWLDHQPNGKGWVDYLNLPALETEVAKGKEANPKVGMDVLKALSSGAPGLELPQFAELRKALRDWPAELIVERSPNLAKAATALEANFQPPSESDVASAKAAAEAAVSRLDRYLKANPRVEAGWKTYFDWKALQAQLAAPTPDAEALAQSRSGLLPTRSDWRCRCSPTSEKRY